jgi:hypothetical protein
VRGECRGETARSGQVAVGVERAGLARAACTAGKDKRTELEPAVEPAVEPEAEEVGAVELREPAVAVAVAAASSGRPGATVPMQPSLPAAVGRVPVRRAEPEHRRSELRTELERPAVGEAGARRLLPAGESWSTAEAILRSWY